VLPLLVVVVLPAVVLSVLATLTAPRSPVPLVARVATAAKDDHLKHGLPYTICRIIGHRRREEAPGIYYCPRCGGALEGRRRHQRRG
jgi:hypothetical protein